MTCIVGIAEQGHVHIGADSASVEGWTVRETKLPKVFRLDQFIIGYTTSFRMGQIIQHHLAVSPQEEESDSRYMVVTFAEAVRMCLKEYGFASIENNKEEGGVFLVGYKDHLYCMIDDYQVNENADGIDACGSGREYAMGAMKALATVPSEIRIRQSLEIAAYFSGGVIPPFHILST